MAVDSNFSSPLFQNLKLDDPWLPSRPWESISSESGVSCSNNSSSISSTQPLYDPSVVSENNLVRLVINALQGVEATLHTIEKLAESFCTEPADRTSNRVTNLWHRTSSTNAMGRILKSIGRTDFVVLILHRFVDYFIQPKLNGIEISRDEEMKRKETDSELRVYLHMKELRTQIEALGNICSLRNIAVAFSKSSVEELTAEAVDGFRDFPRGAELLSYLYTQLRVSLVTSCFLSDGTRAMAGIIERILQCALDFCSCFTGGCWEVGLDQSGSPNSFAHLNFTQVLAIKATLERNLKELYLCYLKSPKHGEFSLCRFWEYLNYNDYYSSVINDGLVHYTF